jgi:hypothetical protein
MYALTISEQIFDYLQKEEQEIFIKILIKTRKEVIIDYLSKIKKENLLNFCNEAIIEYIFREKKEIFLKFCKDFYNIKPGKPDILFNVFFISNDIDLTRSVKNYIENADETSIVISGFASICSKELKTLNITEKFKIIEIDETYWDYLKSASGYCSNGTYHVKYTDEILYVPRNNNQFMNILFIEGVINSYFEGGIEYTFSLHNNLYKGPILNNIRRHFSNIKNII